MRGIRRPRRAACSIVAPLLLAAASQASAQQAPKPPPPQPDTTTVTEPPKPEEPQPQPKQDEVKHVPPDASGIDLTTLETKDLYLLYFDPVQTYLTPYIARAYENALRFHEKTFQWKPWEPTTVLLKDFSDYANAGARASPNNTVLIDVAPLSVTMETFTPGERFFTITNHEMAHVAQMDVWNRQDAFWRHFLHGKVMPIQEHPESILYNYLATPRVNTPRWYLEGGAVFFETWMSGGLGRAQGGYDEMVWRAKVRDNDKFFSPLGLESEGIAVDFQVGVNDYLYGTRFMSYLALKYGPDKFVEWQSRREGSKAFYASQFKKVFGRRLDDVWNDWIAFEHDYQKTNLEKLAQYPLTETVKLSPRGLGSMSRGSTCRQPPPRASSSRRMANHSTAPLITRACRTFTTSISIPRSSKRSATPRPASSARCPSRTDRSSRMNIAVRVFSRSASSPRSRTTSPMSNSSARKWSRNVPS
jgi:hypothetical protein